MMGFIGSHLWKVRQKVGHDLLLIPGVSVLIMNDMNEILFGLRTDMNQWSYIGGSGEAGDSAIDTLMREVKEETGLTPTEFKVIAVTSRYETNHNDYPNGDKLHYWDVVFLVRKWDGDLLRDDEHSRLTFFNLENLPSNMTENCKNRIKILKEFLKTSTFILD